MTMGRPTPDYLRERILELLEFRYDGKPLKNVVIAERLGVSAATVTRIKRAAKEEGRGCLDVPSR